MLADLYRRYFETVIADSDELLREAYRLRYDVYCREHNFLNPDDYPDQLEKDEYDRHSIHALLRYVPTGQLVGTVRMIMPRPGSASLEMPFAHHCTVPTEGFLPVASTAEVSRFAISKSFRRRRTDGLYPDQIEDPARHAIPFMSLGLIAGIVQLGVAHGITHVCAVMDPALLRLLHRTGIYFTTLGPPVEYHGTRQPCYAVGEVLLRSLQQSRPEYWDVIKRNGMTRMPPRAQPTRRSFMALPG